MGSCNDGIDYALGVLVVGPFATAAGTAIPTITLDPEATAPPYKTVTVINDTDQDVKVTYSTDKGYNGSFVVPKSIKGFTKSIRGTFSLSTFKVISLGVGAAAGNISINLSS